MNDTASYRHEGIAAECCGRGSGQVDKVLDGGPGVAGHIDQPRYPGYAPQLADGLARQASSRGVL